MSNIAPLLDKLDVSIKECDEIANVSERISKFGEQQFRAIAIQATASVTGMIRNFLGENYTTSELGVKTGTLKKLTTTGAIVKYDSRGIYVYPGTDSTGQNYKAIAAYRFGALHNSGISNKTVRTKAKKFEQKTGGENFKPARPTFMQLTEPQRRAVRAAWDKAFITSANAWLEAQSNGG